MIHKDIGTGQMELNTHEESSIQLDFENVQQETCVQQDFENVQQGTCVQLDNQSRHLVAAQMELNTYKKNYYSTGC